MFETILGVSHVSSVKWWYRHDLDKGLQTREQLVEEPSLAKEVDQRAWQSRWLMKIETPALGEWLGNIIMEAQMLAEEKSFGHSAVNFAEEMC